MKTHIHERNGTRIAELTSDDLLVSSVEEGFDLMINICYSEIDKMILHEKNIVPEFFDLKTGIAGELLQKFSNYRMRLAIVGDFTAYPGKSIHDFMFESNKLGNINFVGSVEEALEKLPG